MVGNDSVFAQKNALKFYCKNCDFKCSKKCDWKRHILTKKHNGSKMMLIDSSKTPQTAKTYHCECGKSYKWDSGFYRHKRLHLGGPDNKKRLCFF